MASIQDARDYLTSLGVQPEFFNGSAYDKHKIECAIVYLLASGAPQHPPQPQALGVPPTSTAPALGPIYLIELDLRAALLGTATADTTWEQVNLLRDAAKKAEQAIAKYRTEAAASPSPVPLGGGPRLSGAAVEQLGLALAVRPEALEAVRQAANTHEGVYMSSGVAKRLILIMDTAKQVFEAELAAPTQEPGKEAAGA